MRHKRGVSTARELRHRCVRAASARRHRGRYSAWEARHSGVGGAWVRGTGVRAVFAAWERCERRVSTAWGASLLCGRGVTAAWNWDFAFVDARFCPCRRCKVLFGWCQNVTVDSVEDIVSL